jgi:hypothetical protein
MKGGYSEKYEYNERYAKKTKMYLPMSKKNVNKYLQDRVTSVSSMENAQQEFIDEV